MTDPYWCPVEGCGWHDERGKELAAVRSHINAKSDGDHDWSELKPVVEGQAEGDESDEQGEAAEEQPEAAENGENEQAKSSENEAAEQWGSDGSGGKSSDEQATEQQKGGDGEGSTSSQPSGNEQAIPLPLDPSILLLGAAALALVWLWRSLSGDEQPASSAETTDEGADEQAESGDGDGSPPLIEGGN